jgi:hypothetical protein
VGNTFMVLPHIKPVGEPLGFPFGQQNRKEGRAPPYQDEVGLFNPRAKTSNLEYLKPLLVGGGVALNQDVLACQGFKF